MKLLVKVDKRLPKLAWYLSYRFNTEIIELTCGAWVEHNTSFFFEGGWSGAFAKRNVENAATRMGSGGKLLSNSFLIMTPTHTLERVFCITDNKHITFSNSLSFLLERTSKSINAAYALNQAFYDSITLGTTNCKTQLILEDNEYVEMFVNRIIEINKKGLITDVSFKNDTNFHDFCQYRSFIINELKLLRNNLLARSRNIKYNFVATVSSGYDGACAAVLANELGCKTAFTFSNARPKDQLIGKYKYFNRIRCDSGESIAKQLGYQNITIKARNEYLGNDSKLVEAEGCASGNLFFDPIVFYDSVLLKKALITGHYGDIIWDTHGCSKGNSNLKAGGLSGASIYESRLRIGFVHIPLPYIGASQFYIIKRISLSETMAKWSLCNTYDRPIARRILEESGVSRDLFGHNKKAVGVALLGNFNNIISKLSGPSRTSFASFYRKNRPKRKLLPQLFNYLMFFIYILPVMFRKILPKRIWDASFLKLYSFFHSNLFIFSRFPGASSYLLAWGTEICRQRYKERHL